MRRNKEGFYARQGSGTRLFRSGNYVDSVIDGAICASPAVRTVHAKAGSNGRNEGRIPVSIDQGARRNPEVPDSIRIRPRTPLLRGRFLYGFCVARSCVMPAWERSFPLYHAARHKSVATPPFLRLTCDITSS